jgi:hypothetical protein
MKKIVFFAIGLLFLSISVGQSAESDNRKAGDTLELTIQYVKYTFRWCPSGTFQMGEAEQQHQVTLSKGFWLLETEVTQGMWAGVMKNNPSNFKGGETSRGTGIL